MVRKFFRLHDMYARPFEDSLLKIVEKNNKTIVKQFYKGKDVDTEGDTFRLIYHYAIEHSENHVSKMQNYVTLYGFTRTLTFISCILFWEIIILGFYKYYLCYQNSLLKYCFFIKFGLVTFAGFFITFFLYWDFNKFYRKFSMEAYLAAIVAINQSRN